MIIGNITTQALLDTRSTVSTISRNFYNTNFSDQPLQSVTNILNIECADGNQLPYDGYIELDIQIVSAKGTTNQDTTLQQCLFLVVPDSRYNSHVPILIGTNILASFIQLLENRYGERYLQHAQIYASVYMAIRCLTLQEKKLKRQSNRIAIIKSAETKRIIIPPNSEVTIKGYLDKSVPYHPTCCIIQPTKNSIIPDDIDITPTVVPYTYGDTKTVDVNFTNVSTRTVSVTPNAIVCELHPVPIENISRYEEPTTEKDEVITDDGMTICTDGLTQDKIRQGK